MILLFGGFGVDFVIDGLMNLFWIVLNCWIFLSYDVIILIGLVDFFFKLREDDK